MQASRTVGDDAFRAPLPGALTFFPGFLRHPTRVGSVVSSSRFLERRLLAGTSIAVAHSGVELGPGVGETTRAILRAMRSEATLLAIEMGSEFLRAVKRIRDRRLICQLGSAERIAELLSAHQLSPPELIISGVPFSTMSRADGRSLLGAIRGVLAPGGSFVAYQLRSTVADMAAPIFGKAQTHWEYRNVPPLRVYRWNVSR